MRKFNALISKIEEIISIICFSLMSIITLVAVFFRYVLNSPIVWSEEAARYLMIWGICIGVSIATEKKAHLGIDIFVSFAPKKVQRVLSIISYILLILTYLLLVVLSIMFVLMAVETGNVSPMLRIPFWQLYLIMPIGFGLSAIRGIQVLVLQLLGRFEEDTQEEVLL